MRLLRHIKLLVAITIFIAILWDEPTDPGILLLAFIIAMIIVPLTSNFWRRRPAVKRVDKLLFYIMMLTYDIVVANFRIARLVMFMPANKLESGWLVINLNIKRPETLYFFISSITLTPGTVGCDLSMDGRFLLVHVMHLEGKEPQEIAEGIKDRYERRLKEIFEPT